MASKYGDLNCDCIRFRRKLLITAMTMGMAQGAFALPQNGEVVAGSAVLSSGDKNLTIHQSTDRAVINYQSFNVAADERVQFIQPDINSATLNRVLGNDLSDIAGRIDANGQVFLINPNGVLLGEGAQVDVGGLGVSTLDTTDGAFMSGDFALQGKGGVIDNRGTVDADGNVVFAASEIQNSGLIRADGQIALLSGHGVLMTVEGSSIPVLLEEGGFSGRVVNSGHLQGQSVDIAASREGAGDALDVAIENTGVVRAVRASADGGAVTLMAAGADVDNSGTIDASADAALASGSGGSVDIRSRNINQTGEIVVEGAGNGNGGIVNLSADLNIAMHSGSTIRADADQSGQGGEVNIIAENATHFTEDATISARGGQLGGDGGFVEVSGLNFVDVQGTVDVSADTGTAGLWYIDPTDIVIGPAADANGIFSAGDPRIWTLSGTPASSNVSVASLLSALGGGDVIIDTASGAASPGNIIVSALVNYDGIGSIRTLTLNADNEVQFQSGCGFFDGDIGTNADGLNLIINSGGAINMADTALVEAQGGKINMTADTGNIVLSNAFSIASSFDAVQITATTGSIVDAGDTYYDVATPVVGGGAILRSAGDISGLDMRVQNLDAESTAGSIVLGNDIDLTIQRLVAADTISVGSGTVLDLSSASAITADNVYLSAVGLMTLPLAGVSATNYLSVEGSDVVDANGDHTLNLNAGGQLALNITGLSADLVVNSSVAQLNIIGDPTHAISVVDADAIDLAGLVLSGGNVSVSSGAGSDLTVLSALELDGAAADLTLAAGRDLLVNADIVDSVGAVNNSGDVILNANSAVTFAAGSDVNAGSGNVFVTALGGDIALGHILGNSLNLAATGNVSDTNGALANLTGNLASFVSVGGDIGSVADAIDGVINQVGINATTGSAYLDNSQALQVAAIDVGGDIQLNLTGAGNLTMQQVNPAIGGNASFNVATGDWIILDGGWNTNGDLTVSAQSIRDADNTVNLSAANADLTFGGSNAFLSVDFDTLSLDATSGQWVQVFDSDALSVAALTNTTGDINITTPTGFDLTFTDTAPNIGGTLNLDVGGDWVVPDAGVTVANNLTVVADNVLDSDTTTTLGANAADLTLRDGAAGFSIASSFNTLDISAPGAGDISIVDTDGLQVNSLTSAGSLSLSATNADLELVVLPVIAGDLALATIGSGDVVVPAGQISVAGDLNLTADNLDDGDTSYDLVADNAAITLRDGSGGTAWMTQFNSLVMDIGGVGTHTVNNSQDLTVGGLQSGGDLTLNNTGVTDITGATVAVSGGLSVTSSGALSVNGSTVNVGGTTSFDANGDVDMQNATLNLTGNVGITATGGDIALQSTTLSTGSTLALDADNVVETGGASTVSANTLDLQLQDGSLATALSTTISNLDFVNAGSSAITLNNSQTLTVSTLNTSGNVTLTSVGDLDFSGVGGSMPGDVVLTATGGDVIIPDAGATLVNDLTITADDVRDSDADISLGADNVVLNLSAANSDSVWTTSFNTLDLDRQGTGNLTLDNDQALQVLGVQNGGNLALNIAGNLDLQNIVAASNGDFSIATTGVGDLLLQNSAVTAVGDLTLDVNNIVDTGSNSTYSADNAILQMRDGATAATLDTTFNTLSLTNAGSVTVNNSQALAVNALSTSGDVTVASLGDLDFSAVVGALAGDVTLVATGGNLILPDGGLAAANDIALTANDIRDSDADITLSADNAVISLQGANSDAVWTTSFNTLDLDRQGTGNLTLDNDQAIQVLGVQNGGNLALNIAGNLDLQNIVAASNGDLSISTTGVGDLLLQNSAVTAVGDLTLDVNNIVDTGSNSTYSADNAILQMRDGATAATLDTTFNTLSLTNAGSVTVNNSQALAVNALSTSGDVTVASLGDLDFSAVVGALAGDATLVATGGNLILPDGGLTAANDIALTANDIRDSDGDITLAADNAVISLQGANSDAVWTASFNTLDLDRQGAGNLTLNNDQALQVLGVQNGGDLAFNIAGNLDFQNVSSVSASDLSITTTGDWLIPATGFSASNGLTVIAQTIQDGDFDVVLAASDAQFQLGNLTNPAVWSTTFDSLSLSAVGAGAITVNNTQDLTVGALQVGGDANLSALGDLTLVEAAPTSAGDLGLSSTATLWLNTAGFTVANGLVINAATVSDGDLNLVLNADNADITMQNLAADALWSTNFNSLALSVAGTGNLTIDNGGALVATRLQTPADLLMNTAGDLTLLEAAPSIGGDLTLNTSAGGRVVVSDSGLQLTNALVVNASDLIDSDDTVSLQAANADLTLTGLGASRTYNTQFDSASWNLAGASVDVVQTGAHTLLGLTASHDFNLVTDATLTVMPTDFTSTARVSLDSGAAAIALMNTDLSTGGALSLGGLNVTDTSGNPISINSTDLSLTLSGAVLDFNTDVDQLALTANNATQITLSNTGDLFITNWNAPNVQTLGLSVTGDLIVPDAGLSASNGINLEAFDLYDSDRNVALTGGSLWMNLSTPASDLVLSTQVQSADITLGAPASVTINQTGDLTLEDLDSDGFAAQVGDGNLVVSVADGDLQVEGDVLATDASGDGIRTGRVDLSVANGNLTVGAVNDVTIASRNTVDLAPAGNLAPGVSLQLTGTESEDRAITLGNGANTVRLSAEGADIFIRARAEGVPSGSARELVQNAGSVLEAYNQLSDTQTGTVTINNFEVEVADNQQVYADRQIALVMDYDFTNDDSDILDEVDNPEDIEDPEVPEQEANADVGAQFVEAFGQCDENDEQQKKRCRIESALKAFLSHWLVGGELPPKMEI